MPRSPKQSAERRHRGRSAGRHSRRRAAAETSRSHALANALTVGVYAQDGKTELSDTRRETVRLAVRLGADAVALREIVTATRVSLSATITLPAGRYANLSRGRNWQRRSDGVFVDGGVGPGKWVVGSSDGFNRKDKTPWEVKHVQVGNQTWTVAS